MAWTSPRTAAVGDVFTASWWNTDARDNLNAILPHGIAWQSYAVTWSAPTTSPSIGNGTLTGRYRRIGNDVQVMVNLTAGSTTSFGSGVWSFSLPVTGAATIFELTGSALMSDNSAGTELIGTAFRVSSTALGVRAASGSDHNRVGDSFPWTWAQDDYLYAAFSYEAA